MRKTLRTRPRVVRAALLLWLCCVGCPRLATAAEPIPAGAWVLAIEDDRVLGGIGDRIRVRGRFPAGVYRYALYRLPPTPATTAQEALSLQLAGSFGQAELLSVQHDEAVLRILKARHEVRAGDHLQPLDTPAAP